MGAFVWYRNQERADEGRPQHSGGVQPLPDLFRVVGINLLKRVGFEHLSGPFKNESETRRQCSPTDSWILYRPVQVLHGPMIAISASMQRAAPQPELQGGTEVDLRGLRSVAFRTGH